MADFIRKSANLWGKRTLQDGSDTFPVLKKHKQKSEDTTEGFADCRVDKANLISVKDVLFVGNLSPQTEISDIIGFFGKVARVQLIVNHEGKHVGYGFVQFASSREANKALQQKNDKYLHDHKIVLEKPNKISPPPKFSIVHKLWYEEDCLPRESLLIEKDNLETKRNESPDFVEDVLFVSNISPQTEISHLIDFFKNAGKVVRIRLIVNHESKHVGYAFLQFFSANEAKMALEKKNREYLHGHKIFLDVAKRGPCPPRPGFNLTEKLCYEDYIRRVNFRKEEYEGVEGLDEIPDFVEALSVRERSICVRNFPCETEIPDIIKFFKDVGEVVHVRRLLTPKGDYVDLSFVEFASSKEAKKALKKNGEYLDDHKIKVEKTMQIAPPSKYCLDHKVWYEDYLRREGLLIEEDEAVEGVDETSDFVEAFPVIERTLFIANLPCETGIPNIIHFFKDVGIVAHIQLIVDHTGKHMGCGFVEFASADEAEKALDKKNFLHSRKIFLDVVKTAPYPLRPKFSLAEKLWYEEDYLRRESLLIEEDETVEGLDETLDLVEEVPVRERTLYVANLPYESEISDIINFFKDVGEVVHVRLKVSPSTGRFKGNGFVEFASANEANKALEKNGKYMQDRDIDVEKAKKIVAPLNYRIDDKVWYREDYLMKKHVMEMEEETESDVKKFCGKRIIFSHDDDE